MAEEEEEKKKQAGERLPFRTRSPAAHKQKSLLPVSVTALIQAQTDPTAPDLLLHPDREGVSHAAPASRGPPLYTSALDNRVCVCIYIDVYLYMHTHMHTVSLVCVWYDLFRLLGS